MLGALTVILLIILLDLVIAIQFLSTKKRFKSSTRYSVLTVIALCTAIGFFWNNEGYPVLLLIVSLTLLAPPIVLLLRIADENERQKNVLHTIFQMFMSVPSIFLLIGLWDLCINGWG